MDLVEVITTDETTDDTIAKSVDFCLRQGKTVIVVKDTPGFYTSRCIFAYMSLGVFIMRAGVDAERLEQICRKTGLAVGVVTLSDEVGIDVGLHVTETLTEAFRERYGRVCGVEIANEFVAENMLGRKAGKGMFLYENGKRVGSNPRAKEIIEKYGFTSKMKMTDEVIRNQLILKFTDEAVRCLEEGVISSPVDGDVGLVFGTGFPPHLGGPFRYVDNVGAAKVVAHLQEMEEHYGALFTPCQLLIDMAKDPSKKFHKC